MHRSCTLDVLPLLAVIGAAACSSPDKEACKLCDAGPGPDRATDLAEDVPAFSDDAIDAALGDTTVDKNSRLVIDGPQRWTVDTSTVDLAGPINLADASLISFHDFSNGMADGWYAETWPGSNAKSGDWSVIQGDTSSVYSQGVLDTSTWRIAYDGIDLIDNQIVEAKMRIIDFYAKAPSYVVALFGRYDPESDSGYFVALRGDGSLIVRKRDHGQNLSWKNPVDANIQPGVWYTVRLEVIGANVTAFLDGAPVYEVQDDNPLPFGTVALGSYGATLEVDQVFVTGAP
jgi:hypothetical protein